MKPMFVAPYERDRVTETYAYKNDASKRPCRGEVGPVGCSAQLDVQEGEKINIPRAEARVSKQDDDSAVSVIMTGWFVAY